MPLNHKFSDFLSFTKRGSPNSSAKLDVDSNGRFIIEEPTSVSQGSTQIASQGYVDRSSSNIELFVPLNSNDIVMTEDQAKSKVFVVYDVYSNIAGLTKKITVPNTINNLPLIRIVNLSTGTLNVYIGNTDTGISIIPIQTKEFSKFNGNLYSDQLRPSEPGVFRRWFYDFTSDADETTDITNLSYHVIYITDSTNALTASRTLNISPGYLSVGELPFQFVWNKTSYDITYKLNSDSGMVIPSGEGRFVRYEDALFNTLGGTRGIFPVEIYPENLKTNLINITSAYTALPSDYTINCTSNTFNVTLPTAVGIKGKIYIVKNSGAGAITVLPDGTETIDANPSVSLSTTGDKVSVQSDGANWIVIG